MSVFRTTVARLFLVVGMCAWVAGSLAASVHQVLVQHVVCVEHGEVVELDAAGDPLAATDGPELRADSLDPSHDHGCSFDLVCLDGLSVSSHGVVCVRSIDWQHVAQLTTDDGPRGPPLAYAPKTSPPQTS